MILRVMPKSNALVLDVREEETIISLLDNEVEIEKSLITPNRELSEKLLSEIDALLRRKNVLPESVASIRVCSELPDGYSSRRIAETVASMWNLAPLASSANPTQE